jgi:hypothetical protein
MKEIDVYYWRDDECPADRSRDENCICWHEKGTGPFPDALPSDPHSRLEWKKKTVESEDDGAELEMSEMKKDFIKKAWAEGKKIQFMSCFGWMDWTNPSKLDLTLYHDWRLAPKRENVWVKVYYQIQNDNSVLTTNVQLKQTDFTTEVCEECNVTMANQGYLPGSGGWFCIPGDYT